jgi:hypothetical protein
MAKLPSNTPSSAARATLQRICAALERQSDAAAAHRAHQSIGKRLPLSPNKCSRIVSLFCMPRVVAAHAATKSPLNASHQPPKIPSCSRRISRIALTSHVARLVFFYTSHVTAALLSNCTSHSIGIIESVLFQTKIQIVYPFY